MNFEKIKLFLKNTLINVFGKKQTMYNNADGVVNDNNYNISFAKPNKRFFAFLVDSAIIYTLISCFVFIVIKKDLVADGVILKTVESSFEIDANNNISNVKNVEVIVEEKTNEAVVTPISKEDKITKMNEIVINKVYGSRLCRNVIILLPLVYHILYLFTKKRATIGQQMFNLMVIKKNGEKLEFGDIISRVFLFSICKIMFLVPFTIIIPVFVNKNKFTLYDYFTDTCVIEMR